MVLRGSFVEGYFKLTSSVGDFGYKLSKVAMSINPICAGDLGVTLETFR